MDTGKEGTVLVVDVKGNRQMGRAVQIAADHVKTSACQLLHNLFETGDVAHLPTGFESARI